MEIRIDTLTLELFLELYTSVGWEPPYIKQVEKALENSIATFTAYDGDHAIGMVRLIGDGSMSFYCCNSIISINGRGSTSDG